MSRAQPISQYTKLDDDLWSCDNCGDWGTTPHSVRHHSSCRDGESEYWVRFYSDDGSHENWLNTREGFRDLQERTADMNARKRAAR